MIKTGDKIDLAAFESYISLTSSSIVGLVHIEPKNILLISDFDSVFEDDVINVFEKDGRLQAKSDRVKISNSIFDGQSLIDPSIMGDYSDKGMVLLRNRFFKSCAFNCNVQQWFADNGVTDISQLNGTTFAENIEDVKFITTPNSIKYLKFSTFDKWIENLEPDFGVVKYEKPPHFMNGQLVQTHYQLINSVQFTLEEMRAFLQPTFDFMTLVKEDPAVLRYWIQFKIEDEIEISPVLSKTDVIYKMMSVNKDFCRTKLYYDFRTDFMKSFTKDLKCGHVLVNGNYSVLCGNPIEMLMHSIGLFDGIGVVDQHCVYSTRFDFGKTLLASRSPHVSMSNVLITKNKHNNYIQNYMNSTNEIVYINSIGENILQRLAGCDFDSDTVLLTDNEILINAAKKNIDKFPVAVCNVGGIKTQRRYTPDDMADLDVKTSKNLIGDIINLSQELNSDIWDQMAKGATYQDIEKEYLDVCKLSIMSGIEIDKAKKEFVIDNGTELMDIRARWQKVVDGKTIKPNFFAHIARKKGYYNPQKKNYKKHKTSMDYLQQCVNSYRMSSRKIGTQSDLIPFSSVINKQGFNYENVRDKDIYNVLSLIEETNKTISAIYTDVSLEKQEQHIEAKRIRQDFIEDIGELILNRDTMIALLQTIEKPENSRYWRFLFYTFFGYPNTSFYKVIKSSIGEIDEIEQSDDGEIVIYAQKHTKKRRKRPPSLF